MKYFILHVAVDEEDDFSKDYYIKGKSIEYVTERITHYSNGCLCTTKFSLLTQHVQHGFIREIDLKHYPGLTAKAFGQINESRSYNLSDLS